MGFGAGLTWGAIALQWMETERRVSRTRRGRIRLRGLLARLRATVMRVVRRLEGLIWGAANDPKG